MSERAIPPTPQQRERQARVLGDLWEGCDLKLTPLAAAVGVAASTMSRYISGETILPQQSYDRIADVFGISRIDLVIRLGLLDDEDEQIREAVDALLAVAKKDQPRQPRPISKKRAQLRRKRTAT